MAGVYGNPFPVNIETLGGSIGWKTGASLGLMAALWSVLALSGTLAAEARRGSLEFVATTPLGKRRIAVEKLAAHVTGMAIVVIVTFRLRLRRRVASATLPGDAIPSTSALGFGLWVGVVALASGAVAFALAPFVGRGASGGDRRRDPRRSATSPTATRTPSPAFAPFANLTWWGWTAHHQPLVGSFDWVSLVPAIDLAIVLFIVASSRSRGATWALTSRVPGRGMPALAHRPPRPDQPLAGERLPLAVSWGIGIGLMGFIFGAASLSLTDAVADLSPDTLAIYRPCSRTSTSTGAGAFLQLRSSRSG